VAYWWHHWTLRMGTRNASSMIGEGQFVFYTGATGTHRSVARRVAPPAGPAAPVAAAGARTRIPSKVHVQRKQLVALVDGTLRLRVTDSYAHGACTFEYDPGATGRFTETESLKTAEWITKKPANSTYKITLVDADEESCTFEFLPE
jgi:hypothetical protein